MRATLWQQQVQNLNLFTQNLANHLNVFFKRLEEANNDKSIPVTNNETSKHSCSKVIANNGDTQGSISKVTANNGDENNKKKANKHTLVVKDGENPRNKRRRPLLRLEGNKKHHYGNSNCKYKPNCKYKGNASASNEMMKMR